MQMLCKAKGSMLFTTNDERQNAAWPLLLVKQAGKARLVSGIMSDRCLGILRETGMMLHLCSADAPSAARGKADG